MTMKKPNKENVKIIVCLSIIPVMLIIAAIVGCSLG